MEDINNKNEIDNNQNTSIIPNSKNRDPYEFVYVTPSIKKISKPYQSTKIINF